MGSLFGTPKGPQTVKYTAINISTSTQGVPIPIGWGRNRVGSNIIWYNDFLATPAPQSSGGKGGPSGTTTYNYSAAVVLAVGEGYINNVTKAWANKDVTTLSALNLTLVNGGGTAYAMTSTTTANSVLNFASGSVQSYVVGWSVNCQSGGIPVGTKVYSATTSSVTLSTLANVLVNVTLPAGSVINFYPQAPSSLYANHPTQSSPYQRTAYLYSSLYKMGSSPDLPSHNFEVSWWLDESMVAGNYDANPAAITENFLGDSITGVGLPGSAIDYTSLGIVAGNPDTANHTSWWSYCAAAGLLMSPLLTTLEQVTNTLQRWGQLTNTLIFWSGDKLKFVPMGDTNLSATYGSNTYTYTPDINPIYALTLDDFIVSGPGEMPVTISRKDPADLYSFIQLDCLDRNNNYNNATVQWQDQTSIDMFGRMQAQSITAHDICLPSIATISAALIGQRSVWIRNIYKFRLGYNYLLLEVGDIVSLTDPTTGLSAQTVRVTDIQETAEQLLEITAEEFNIGVGNVSSAVTNAAQGGGSPNKFVDPGNINNPPLLFFPPQGYSNGSPQLFVGASGGADWGGSRVYVSLDGGANYAFIATVFAGIEQGYTTSAITNNINPATNGTLSVDLTSSIGVIPSGATNADANAARTSCLVGNEILSYGSVSVTGTNTFNLSYLVRAQLGTSVAAQSIGTRFTKLDRNFTFVYNLPYGYSGATIYFKFLSYNTYENMLQSLSAVSAYSITLPSYSGGVITGPGGGGTYSGGGSEGAGGGGG